MDSPKLYSRAGFRLLALDIETDKIIESISSLLLGMVSKGTDNTLASFLDLNLLSSIPVSYTHLPLPTICSV